MRRAARSDTNQQAVIEALRRCGVSVEIIGKPVDLLVWHRGETSLVEVKNRDGRNRLTQEQISFMEKWPGKVHVVRDETEALRAILGAEVMR